MLYCYLIPFTYLCAFDLCLIFSFTFDGHLVVLHGGQHLVQLLLTCHVLNLTQVEFLKLYRNISTLKWDRDKNSALTYISSNSVC